MSEEVSEEQQPRIRKSVYEAAPTIVKRASVVDNKKDNLWKRILSDVAKRDVQNDVTLLLLGDIGCGKRSLIREMNNKHVFGHNKSISVEKMGSDFSALDYSFLFTKDLSDRDNLEQPIQVEDNTAKVDVWTMHDCENADLLETVINPQAMENLCAAIVLDLNQPWELMNQLRKWLKVLQDTIFKLMPEMPPGVYERMKTKIENQWKTFEEPQFDDQGNLIKKLRVEKHAQNSSDESDGEEEVDARLDLDLPESCLKVNLGIPVLVIVQKVDLLLHGDKK